MIEIDLNFLNPLWNRIVDSVRKCTSQGLIMDLYNIHVSLLTFPFLCIPVIVLILKVSHWQILLSRKLNIYPRVKQECAVMYKLTVTNNQVSMIHLVLKILLELQIVRINKIRQIYIFLRYLFIWLYSILVVICEIEFPDQGSYLGPLHWECRILATGPPGKSWICIFKTGLVIAEPLLEWQESSRMIEWLPFICDFYLGRFLTSFFLLKFEY